ncbi:hypothetical protein FJZ19_05040 [Candidatus Pacearchaeota archaeon]|nr:hypothetical protein [Candidatus Pacearchaeota archaeon]
MKNPRISPQIYRTQQRLIGRLERFLGIQLTNLEESTIRQILLQIKENKGKYSRFSEEDIENAINMFFLQYVDYSDLAHREEMNSGWPEYFGNGNCIKGWFDYFRMSRERHNALL